MNKKLNTAFLAFLAWMATLMVIAMLSSCTTYDAHSEYIHPQCNGCAAYQ